MPCKGQKVYSGANGVEPCLMIPVKEPTWLKGEAVPIRSLGSFKMSLQIAATSK